MSVVSIPPRSYSFPPTSTAAPAAQPVSSRGAGGGEVGQGELLSVGGLDPALHSTLERLASYVRKTRLQLRPHFSDFDRSRSGAVSSSQFARVLATVGFSGLTHSLVSLLSERYALPADGSKVSYKAFLADLDAIADAQQAAAHESLRRATAGPTIDFEASVAPLTRTTAAASAAGGAESGGMSLHASAAFARADPHAQHPLSATKLLHKIQTQCLQRRVQLADLFADFDPLRHHRVTLQQFRRCLDVAGFQLRDEEANLLVDRYLSSEEHPPRVCYKDFVRDVSAPFVPEGAERDPRGVNDAPPFRPYRLEEQETPAPALSEAERARIDALLSELGYLVHTRRMLVKPSFAPHDASRHGVVTARQFGSVLLSLFPSVRFSARDVELLASRYRRASEGVSYLAFLSELGAREAGASEYAKTLHPSHAAAHLAAMGPPPLQATLSRAGGAIVAGMKVGGGPEPNPTDDQVLRRIREQLSRARQTIDDVFKGAGFDPLNKGTVTRAQFARCLSLAGLRLSPLEVNALAERYPNSEMPDGVYYRAFVQELSDIPRF